MLMMINYDSESDSIFMFFIYTHTHTYIPKHIYLKVSLQHSFLNTAQKLLTSKYFQIINEIENEEDFFYAFYVVYHQEKLWCVCV